MGNVVSLNEMRKQMQGGKALQEPERDMEKYRTKTFFFNVDGVRIDFGGAFIRELFEGLQENITGIKQNFYMLTLNGYASIKHSILEKEKNNDADELELLFATEEGIVKVSSESFLFEELKNTYFNRTEEEIHQDVNNIFDPIKAPQDLADIFDKREMLAIVPNIFACIMYESFNEFDYARFVRDNYLMMACSPKEMSDLLNETFSDVYKEYDKLKEWNKNN